MTGTVKGFLLYFQGLHSELELSDNYSRACSIADRYDLKIVAIDYPMHTGDERSFFKRGLTLKNMEDAFLKKFEQEYDRLCCSGYNKQVPVYIVASSMGAWVALSFLNTILCSRLIYLGHISIKNIVLLDPMFNFVNPIYEQLPKWQQFVVSTFGYPYQLTNADDSLVWHFFPASLVRSCRQSDITAVRFNYKGPVTVVVNDHANGLLDKAGVDVKLLLNQFFTGQATVDIQQTSVQDSPIIAERAFTIAMPE